MGIFNIVMILNIIAIIQWIQNSNSPCQQSVLACGFSAGPQNNWLITQLINRTVNGTRLPQVSVTIEFELQGCDTTLNCQKTFNTHIYETSSVDSDEARNISNYQQVQRVSPDNTDGTRVNETVVINFSTDHQAFYFAIQDETSCIVITRLIMFYYICPKQTADLIIFPETFAPPGNQAGIPLVSVTASCVANAEPENGLAPLPSCLSEGIWSLVPTAGCKCTAGSPQSKETCENKQSHLVFIVWVIWGRGGKEAHTDEYRLDTEAKGCTGFRILKTLI